MGANIVEARRALQLVAEPLPEGRFAPDPGDVYTTSIIAVGDRYHVRLTRWLTSGRYAAQLMDIDVELRDGETELAALQRVLAVASSYLSQRRFEE